MTGIERDKNIIIDLDEFLRKDPQWVNRYFKYIGSSWQLIDCFNDNKYVWINILLNKSIIAKTEMIEEDSLGNEMIVDIWCIDSIYSES
jgi:hypothetical protein